MADSSLRRSGGLLPRVRFRLVAAAKTGSLSLMLPPDTTACCDVASAGLKFRAKLMEVNRVVSIREERGADRKAIRTVNEKAFEGRTEAELVERLRSNDRVLLSLVAEFVDPASPEANRIVGHILFSEALLFSEGGFSRSVVALAPMAVLPEFQRQGIGSRLVKVGLDRLKRSGHRAVFVLGHADYYPRFGFQVAGRFGIPCPYDVPDEAFMVLELQPNALKGAQGPLHYAPEFAEV